MPITTAYEAKIEHLQILDETGKLDARLARGTLTDKDVVYLYEHMSTCRHYDEVAFKLQRSGRMGTYPQNIGQEAAAAGSGFAMRKQDYIVPCYRENAALFHHGLPMEKILLHWMGDERGNEIPEGVHVLPISIPIGTHMLHAAGIAWAFKLRKEDRVAITYFGDGATSEGDFHEAMNFATTLKLPCIFFCQNNSWAISVPREKQMASKTVVQKALAYEAHGIRVDGNDIFACYKATKDAIARAKKGQPTLIEAVTYRLGDHTTADDARRYRDQAELDAWKKKDPLLRVRIYLENKKLWNDKKQTALEARAKEFVTQVVKNAEGIEAPTTDDIFDHTFATLPEQLLVQKRTLRTNGLGQFPEQETLRA
ncbi:MAG: pyruvate dehydrogenase (acetyl-transferring) E1 component subunit alpha [Phycisphaerales bacterium]|nr:MAG: pyruvate dehydrogenase (acetyl-transferring) E1 component subunit alpha [Phycisphaerales bacterium]